MDPKAIAERYFAAITARNINDLIGLYADDATLVLPNGKESKGVAAIEQTHQGVFNAAAPTPFPQAMIVGDAAIAVEVEARMPDGTSRRTANFFHLNSQGRIQRLNIYMRSG